MRRRTYPGRLTQEQWREHKVRQRYVLAARACADLLELWRSCSNKSCRRAHSCQGDERCRDRPHETDFKNPNFGRPDFVSSFRFPEHLRTPWAILSRLPYWPEPPTPEEILEECAVRAGAGAAATLRRAFRLERALRANRGEGAVNGRRPRGGTEPFGGRDGGASVRRKTNHG